MRLNAVETGCATCGAYILPFSEVPPTEHREAHRDFVAFAAIVRLMREKHALHERGFEQAVRLASHELRRQATDAEPQRGVGNRNPQRLYARHRLPRAR